MVLFQKFLSQNLIQIYTKTHQIAPFKKQFLGGGGHAPEPPSKAHGNVDLRHANFYIPPKIILAPPLPNPGDAPDVNIIVRQLF